MSAADSRIVEMLDEQAQKGLLLLRGVPLIRARAQSLTLVENGWRNGFGRQKFNIVFGPAEEIESLLVDATDEAGVQLNLLRVSFAAWKESVRLGGVWSFQFASLLRDNRHGIARAHAAQCVWYQSVLKHYAPALDKARKLG
jgi:hypothetical protein